MTSGSGTVMQITVKIENTYSDDTIVITETVDVPEPHLNDEEMEEWWNEHIFPLTGTGHHRRHYDAVYEAKITKCDTLPQLVGETHEWG